MDDQRVDRKSGGGMIARGMLRTVRLVVLLVIGAALGGYCLGIMLFFSGGEADATGTFAKGAAIGALCGVTAELFWRRMSKRI
jgi:hypothetical protein